ncbi:SDR family oxidoreductase [Blochmannia endosymbiont of Polyrhachis (Hedomyrma) turneri]|uniref:SDR family oxidoreductase n=1 Tax=Blochmannia endosymbiont of Polyrhachis (Hedomyrma) turneri TaxID=1505596 RepID=UPI00061A7139|nr:SDR family oxidoreductase [Blochmannia endosymbiont of Polyrhachis (Hedomyrma) turneri]AKC59985.1 Enoyl-[acyl-carrier-protein] reductase [NADH] FabI [Blochmannia endosymbiont of Polyrhachis (Hedomyrma) turneri]
MGFLDGRRVLITGVASYRSLAYGIAKAMYREGAQLAFTYQNNKLKDRVRKIANDFGSDIVLPCDVSEDESINDLFLHLSKFWLKFDGFVHAIAYASNDQLNGDYVESITREGFSVAHNVTSYSFVALAKACRNMLSTCSSLVTLTYLGSVRAIPNYNVMGLAKASLEANMRYMARSLGAEGIRVNAISSGPVRTLAASGIMNFKQMLSYCKDKSPMCRNVTIDEIGNVAAFLCSDLSSGITGEVIYVDAGFSVV